MTLWKKFEQAACFASALANFRSHTGGSQCNGIPTALTEQGLVQGYLENTTGNHVFKGIPYAQTTGGANRWKAPQKLDTNQSSIQNATSYGPTCPQAIGGSVAGGNGQFTQQGEDCLNLNIWAPSSGDNLPVFVFVYGGAMVTGSSSNPTLQGSNFAAKDVIYVNFNTRESIFASPYSSELANSPTSQNFGILDVEAAMEWIHTNIQAFGGDPNKIVMGGHSSGSVHVDHYLWNHPDTFLAGAIEMSANAKSGPAYAPEHVALDVVAESVNCTDSAGQLECLRGVDIYDFQTTYFNSTSNTWFCPYIDEKTRFSDYPARFAAGKYPKHVPMIVGNANNEGGIFSHVYSSENTDFSVWINTFDADLGFVPDDELLTAYNAADYDSVSLMSGDSYGEARFVCATDYLLDIRSSEQDTWIYRWFGDYDNVNAASGLGPTHGSELAFFHGGNNCFDDVSNVTAAEQQLAEFTNDWLVAWIKNPSAGPGWEKATPINGPLAKLGVPGNETAVLNAKTGDFNPRCQTLYKPHYPQYPVVQSPVSLTNGPSFGPNPKSPNSNMRSNSHRMKSGANPKPSTSNMRPNRNRIQNYY